MSAKKLKTEDKESILAPLLLKLKLKDGHKTEFIQCVEEISTTLEPLFVENPELLDIFERLLEPERLIQFRVAWVDDKGKTQVNRAFRVQYSSALGPYKGGLRFHPSVNASVLEFLGLEQILKNALTGLPLGGGKGGSDFDPKGKSDQEVMRFCQQFMSELYRHIGANVDVPAGDIGVGGREVGYMYGYFKKLTRSFEGSLTGKGEMWGGSALRPEATGFGVVFFSLECIRYYTKHDGLLGKRCAVSGSGNVALHCAQQLIKEGALVISLSDSQGFIYAPKGLTMAELNEVIELKEVKRERLSAYSSTSVEYVNGKSPFSMLQCDFAFPCATQNEILIEHAQALVKNGVLGVFEGANMPSTNEAISFLKDRKVLFGPSKAVNAGGVAVSGLEMSQNSARLSWSRDEVELKLRKIMKDIFNTCRSASESHGHPGDLQFGANVAGFLKVAKAMKDQGIV